MHGRTTARFILLLGTLIAGCDDVSPITQPADPLADAASAFNAAESGTIEGQVTWAGDVPIVAPFRSPLHTMAEPAGNDRRFWPNPNAPLVHTEPHGVAGAVVFLRGIDPRKARPWDHPAVRVVMCDHQYHIHQGTSDARTGFVRRGDAVVMVSEQVAFQSLQARGAAFFALPFPDADQPRERRLTRNGLVELTSGAGHFWMRGYLFVDDHPYYTRSDAEGRFRLEQVPPGKYEVVCWLPNWREAEHERDADTCQISRLTFRSPVEVVQQLQLDPRQTRATRFTLSADLFER